MATIRTSINGKMKDLEILEQLPAIGSIDEMQEWKVESVSKVYLYNHDLFYESGLEIFEITEEEIETGEQFHKYVAMYTYENLDDQLSGCEIMLNYNSNVDNKAEFLGCTVVLWNEETEENDEINFKTTAELKNWLDQKKLKLFNIKL